MINATEQCDTSTIILSLPQHIPQLKIVAMDIIELDDIDYISQTTSWLDEMIRRDPDVFSAEDLTDFAFQLLVTSHNEAHEVGRKWLNKAREMDPMRVSVLEQQAIGWIWSSR